VTYLDVKSSWGHDAFLLEVETMTNLLDSFLGRLVREEQIAVPLVSPARALMRVGASQPPRAKLAESLA
jgi:hypothetical protein